LGSISLLGIGLVIYDLELNAVYRRGDFAKPFHEFVTLNFKDFDRIQLNSASSMNVLFIQGEFKVLANPKIMDWLEVRKDGRQLTLTAKFADHHTGYGSDQYAIYISCPRLEEITTDGQYFVRGVKTVDTNARNLWYLPTLIKGFRLDSLAIYETRGGNLVMEDDRIDRLTALVGGGSGLTISSSNSIGGGEMSVLDNSTLILKDTSSLKLHYHLADDAGVNLNGAAAKHLLK
jgi:hypothetical protein